MIHLGLDFVDAGISRVAAWVIGACTLLRALLLALLEPTALLQGREAAGDHTARLALMEERKTLPCGAVRDDFGQESGVPVGPAWLEDVRHHEEDVLSRRH